MSFYLTTRAIVLEEEPYREQDMQFRLLTERGGVQTAVLRGARAHDSKLRPHLLRFDRSLVTLVQQGTRSYVSHAALEQRLRIDGSLLTRYRAAAIVAALVCMARSGAEDYAHLFLLAEQCFASLNSRSREFVSSLLPLAAGIVVISGVKPQITHCSTCRRAVSNVDDPLYFSLLHGSVYHASCRHPERSNAVSGAVMRDLQLVFSGYASRHPTQSFAFLVEFSKYHLEYKK